MSLQYVLAVEVIAAILAYHAPPSSLTMSAPTCSFSEYYEDVNNMLIAHQNILLLTSILF